MFPQLINFDLPPHSRLAIRPGTPGVVKGFLLLVPAIVGPSKGSVRRDSASDPLNAVIDLFHRGRLKIRPAKGLTDSARGEARLFASAIPRLMP
jgi:hypothetical protein